MKEKIRRFRAHLLAALVLVLGGWAFYCGLTVTTYSLASAKIQRPVRLVVLTDLHSHLYGPGQERLIRQVKDLRPDLIFLVGDIADDRAPIKGTALLLAGLRGTAGMYYVTGNHEYYGLEVETIKNIIRGYGVMILEDESRALTVNGNTLVVAGLEDPVRKYNGYPAYDQLSIMKRAFAGLEAAPGYKILLAHRPERIEEYRRHPFDLVLSGHAHGGQARLPGLPYGLAAPHQGFLPRYSGGLYRHPGLDHIVGRGLSFDPLLPRIFNPPEIVVVDLLPAAGKAD